MSALTAWSCMWRRTDEVTATEKVVIGDCTLYRGDCLEVLPTLEAGSVDAVVTDPPYGVNLKYSQCDDNAESHAKKVPTWFSLMRSTTSGPIVAATGTKSLSLWLSVYEKPTWVLCWWKPAAMGRCHVGFNNWEPIVLWGKARGKKGCDVIRACIKPDANLSGHPCPKPLEWAEGILALIAKKEDCILDPFMGSGTTGVACIRTGRKFIGVELDKGYFDIACKRIEAEHAASK